MEKSPLRFLKDFDIITILNEEVPKSREKFAREFHSNLYRDKLNNNHNYFSKIHIDDTFWKMTMKRMLSENVSFMSSVYPFYNCPDTNTLDVNHAIQTYEEYNDGDLLPCGTLSTGAQCMCNICYGMIDDY